MAHVIELKAFNNDNTWAFTFSVIEAVCILYDAWQNTENLKLSLQFLIIEGLIVNPTMFKVIKTYQEVLKDPRRYNFSTKSAIKSFQQC